jgi:hypothetical protein
MMKEGYIGSNHAMHGDQAEPALPDQPESEPTETLVSASVATSDSPPQQSGEDTTDAPPAISGAPSDSSRQQLEQKPLTDSNLKPEQASSPAEIAQASKAASPVSENQIGSAGTDATTISTRQLMIDLNIERLLPVFTGDTGNLQGIRFYLPEMKEPIQINRTLISIGRSDPANNIRPTLDLTPYHGLELGVSRYHAEIIFNNDKYYIKDIGSTNGTWINMRKIPPYQQIPMFSGDQIRFGHLAMVIRFLEK